MKLFWLLPTLLLSAAAQAAPSVLSEIPGSDVGYTNVAAAVNAVLGTSPSRIDNPIFNDSCTAVSAACSGGIVAASSNTSASFTSIASGLTVNHATYQVLSFTVAPMANPDASSYATLEAQGTYYALPYGRPGTLPKQPVSISASFISSANSRDGSTGWGIEFGMSASYLGLNTSDDSHTSPALAGFAAALMYNHPSYTPFDVKAALRITAGNWATGYDHTNYGFGTVNWSAANSASTLYLQAPGVTIQNFGYYASITLYPFRQTRRAKEVVYIGGTWPSPATGCSGSTCNEYTAAQIAAAAGTLIYTSNGTDVTPTFSYVPAISGTATFYVLTLDSSGNGSRVEEFNGLAETFTVGSACIQ